MVVIVEEKVRKISCAMNARAVATCIGPFTGYCLDEAFGFAVGLRTIWFGEAMLNAEFTAGSREVFGAVG